MMIETGITLAFGCALLGGQVGILRSLGRDLGDCPITGTVAKAASLSVIGAFASIGLGAIALVTAGTQNARFGDIPSVLVGTGTTAVVLGIGFAIAATAVRDALLSARREMRDAALDAPRASMEATA